MAYFNYHAKAKNNIKNGNLICYRFVDEWNKISPAMVLFFTNCKPMPIRQERWQEYIMLIEEIQKPL